MSCSNILSANVFSHISQITQGNAPILYTFSLFKQHFVQPLILKYSREKGYFQTICFKHTFHYTILASDTLGWD